MSGMKITGMTTAVIITQPIQFNPALLTPRRFNSHADHANPDGRDTDRLQPLHRFAETPASENQHHAESRGVDNPLQRH